MHTHAHKRNTN